MYPYFAAIVLFTDEFTFARDGAFNTHNKHVRANVNTHAPQRRFSISVWLGIIGDNLIGPCILPECFNGKKYLTFLKKVQPDLLEDEPTEIRRAPYEVEARWSTSSLCARSATLSGRDLSWPIDLKRWFYRLTTTIAWPVIISDSFLWGKLDSLIYATFLESEEELVVRLSVAAGGVHAKSIFHSVRQSHLLHC